MDYPKWIYHHSEPAKIVNDPTEHESHGKDWKESPAHFLTPKPEKPTVKPKASGK